MKYTHFLVEYFDRVSGRWGERMFTSRKQADIYMDGIHDLLKVSGDPRPVVGMQFLTTQQGKNWRKPNRRQ